MRTATIARYPGYVFCENGDVIGRMGRVITGEVGKVTGYRRVLICDGGGIHTARKCLVQRLICEAFHGPPPSPDHQAAHNNGVRLDNRATNVRWATRSENQIDRFRHGTHGLGEKNAAAKTSEQVIRKIRLEYARGVTTHRGLAEKYGLTKTMVGYIVRRQNWSHVR